MPSSSLRVRCRSSTCCPRKADRSCSAANSSSASGLTLPSRASRRSASAGPLLLRRPVVGRLGVLGVPPGVRRHRAGRAVLGEQQVRLDARPPRRCAARGPRPAAAVRSGPSPRGGAGRAAGRRPRRCAGPSSRTSLSRASCSARSRSAAARSSAACSSERGEPRGGGAGEFGDGAGRVGGPGPLHAGAARPSPGPPARRRRPGAARRPVPADPDACSWSRCGGRAAPRPPRRGRCPEWRRAGLRSSADGSTGASSCPAAASRASRSAHGLARPGPGRRRASPGPARCARPPRRRPGPRRACRATSSCSAAMAASESCSAASAASTSTCGVAGRRLRASDDRRAAAASRAFGRRRAAPRPRRRPRRPAAATARRVRRPGPAPARRRPRPTVTAVGTGAGHVGRGRRDRRRRRRRPAAGRALRTSAGRCADEVPRPATAARRRVPSERRAAEPAATPPTSTATRASSAAARRSASTAAAGIGDREPLRRGAERRRERPPPRRARTCSRSATAPSRPGVGSREQPRGAVLALQRQGQRVAGGGARRPGRGPPRLLGRRGGRAPRGPRRARADAASCRASSASSCSSKPSISAARAAAACSCSAARARAASAAAASRRSSASTEASRPRAASTRAGEPGEPLASVGHRAGRGPDRGVVRVQGRLGGARAARRGSSVCCARAAASASWRLGRPRPARPRLRAPRGRGRPAPARRSRSARPAARPAPRTAPSRSAEPGQGVPGVAGGAGPGAVGRRRPRAAAPPRRGGGSRRSARPASRGGQRLVLDAAGRRAPRGRRPRSSASSRSRASRSVAWMAPAFRAASACRPSGPSWRRSSAERSSSRARLAAGRVELAQRPLLALPVLEDTGGFLDEAAPVLGTGGEHGVERALPDHDVHLAADAGVGQQFLDVEQPAGAAVDRVLGLAGPVHQPADRDLGVVDRQDAVAVVDGEQHLGPAERGAAGRAGEDDVFHLPAAERLGALLAEHPGDGVDDVALPGAVRADHTGHAGLELQGRGAREGLEAPQGQALEVHRRGR